jgi:hypothetical protein
MASDFEQILDACIERLNHGETVKACLTDYPEFASQLEPLLNTMSRTKDVLAFNPSSDAKRIARQRFYAVLEKRSRPSLMERLRVHRMAWAALASVILILVFSYVALRATVFPVISPPLTVSGPSANGNFFFLVSDEVNAISDFTNLNVAIEKVGLFKNSGDRQWIEFVPEVKQFDLALLPGSETQELWRGDVPEGDYSKVVIYVGSVQGTLKSNGATIDIKLPSNKLQLSKTFQVSAGIVTSFTYDLTVVNAGNARKVKYILKPQIGESGTQQQLEQTPIQSFRSNIGDIDYGIGRMCRSDLNNQCAKYNIRQTGSSGDGRARSARSDQCHGNGDQRRNSSGWDHRYTRTIYLDANR